MCGRYSATTPIADIVKLFGVQETKVEDFQPSWNVAPTRDVLVVRTNSGGERELDQFKWGLVPSWAKDPSIGNKMINARAESLAKSNAYRRAFASRRCLLPADGYYEWKAGETKKDPKEPFYFHPADGGPIALGGLWELWHDAEDQLLLTCTIITVEPNELAAKVHNRMPLVLPPDTWDVWLDKSPLSEADAARLLLPAQESLLEATQVSTEVNNVRNDGPELINAV